jgi:hypothetical protein
MIEKSKKKSRDKIPEEIKILNRTKEQVSVYSKIKNFIKQLNIF